MTCGLVPTRCEGETGVMITEPSSYADADLVTVVTVPSPFVVTMVVVGITAGARGTTTEAWCTGTATTGTVVPGTGFAGGTTTISVEPWIRYPAASAEPTTMPSTTASGNVMIEPAADARSVKIPGRWTMMVCCAWTHAQIMVQRMRARNIFFIMGIPFCFFCSDKFIMYLQFWNISSKNDERHNLTHWRKQTVWKSIKKRVCIQPLFYRCRLPIEEKSAKTIGKYLSYIGTIRNPNRQLLFRIENPSSRTLKKKGGRFTCHTHRIRRAVP